jgi:hypothetical protein
LLVYSAIAQPQAQTQIENLYKLFLAVDATQVEINPFGETPQGEGLLAHDIVPFVAVKEYLISICGVHCLTAQLCASMRRSTSMTTPSSARRKFSPCATLPRRLKNYISIEIALVYL